MIATKRFKKIKNLRKPLIKTASLRGKLCHFNTADVMDSVLIPGAVSVPLLPRDSKAAASLTIYKISIHRELLSFGHHADDD